MNYKVLIFDADGTLFDFEQAEQQAFYAMLKDFDILPSNDLFESYLIENKKAWSDLEQGNITQEELKTRRFLGFIRVASLEGNAKAYAASYMHHLSEQSILYPDALNIIEKLSKDYTLTILTNGLREVQHQRIRYSALRPYIKDVVISDELGIAKPNPKIIEYALKNINHLEKENVMIIGDSLTSDIQGGLNASITTVWYNPNRIINKTTIKPTHEIHSLDELFMLLEKK